MVEYIDRGKIVPVQLPAFSDATFWQNYLMTVAIITMNNEMLGEPPISPPKKHKSKVSSQFASIVNQSRLTAMYINHLEETKTPQEVCNIIRDLIEHALESGRIIDYLDDSVMKSSMVVIDMTYYPAEESHRQIVETPLIAKTHYVVHFNGF